jgi:uncharacterized protein YifE (UPF0438 family)
MARHGLEELPMAQRPADHPATLEQRPFHFGCSTEIFPAEEVQALAKLGNRLEALVSGSIQPATADEEHFLQVDRELAEPASLPERAWMRLKGRREFERERQRHEPSPPEEYGIVEWDKDRCWW